ncbi:MAG: alanine racemase [Wujia sp.]
MTTLNIQINALEHNIDIIKKLTPNSKIIAVLKGNAYGLGLCKFSSFLYAHGIRHFAVTELSDAVMLRKNGIEGDILLMTPVYNAKDITTAIKHDITLSITSRECGLAIEATAAYRNHFSVHAHICIDTGFGRYGFQCDKITQIAEIAEMVHSLSHVQITGIFSHFYAATCRNDRYVKNQFQQFCLVCDTLKEAGISTGIRHISSSSSMLRFPDMNLDAVRIGSAFLGRLAVPDNYDFQTVCHLSACVDDIYDLPAGHNIGYGNNCRLAKPCTTAVVSAGYYHGLGLERETMQKKNPISPLHIARLVKRACKKKLPPAIFEGHSLPILGQINMNSVIVDASDCPLSVGDFVSFPINPLFVNSTIPRVYT